MLKVVKRNGQIVDFDKSKIEKAIQEAMNDIGKELTDKHIQVSKRIAHDIQKEFEKDGQEKYHIEDIQNKVEDKLMHSQLKDVAKQYIKYRYHKHLLRQVDEKMFQRNKNVLDLLEGKNDYLKTENANKDATVHSTARDYMAGEVSKELCELIYDKDLLEANKQGIIKIHDMDFISMREYNCALLNIKDMLENGTRLSGVYIHKPKSLHTAATLMTQIMMQVAANQYGGQTVSLAHLAPFVRISKEKYFKQFQDLGFTGEQLGILVDESLKKELKDSIQTILYQLVTYSGVQGQSPFCSIFMWINEDPEYIEENAMLIEEMLKQREAGVPGKDGHPITIAFPKLLYVLDDNNTYQGSQYYYLTELAAKCTAKRMVPDYISAKQMKRLKEGNVYPCMGCRSFLQPYKENGEYKFYGRFNQGVVTLNLVDVALSSQKNEEEFWRLMEERTQLCYRALITRHKRLKGTLSDVAPILWQDGAISRLQPGETIDKYLYGDYSSISLGFAGLYECVYYMKGCSHTDKKGKDFAMKIMDYLNQQCQQWKEKTNIGFSLYGTPMESATYTFAKGLKKRFGIIEGVTDHDYITNSYHVNVRENIDAFTKLKFESEFQDKSLGGAISYVEIPNMSKNILALIILIQYIYENIMYAECNTRSDYCFECGYEGEMLMDDKMEWYCPNCGNKDFKKMSIPRRVCGYISTSPMNFGRKSEIHDRVLHL